MPAVPRVVIVLPSEQAVPDGENAPQYGYGFPPASRLHKTEEFSSVFAFRRVLRGHFCSLHWCPNGRDGARLGVIAAKRLAHHACTRNLVKRIARESFRLARPHLPAHDLIVRLHARLEAVPRKALRADLDALYRRLPAAR